MRYWIQQMIFCVATTAFASGAAFADKPESPGNSGKSKAATNSSEHAAQPGNSGNAPYFSDERVSLIRQYYLQTPTSAGCPPGLAKKGNGCQPPGQAKKWHRGEYLPPDAIYQELPLALLNELGRTPEGQKIIRIGTAILLINAASGLIADVIED
ncbi:MAG: hypothetical protein KDI17_00540 [Halioglobus sp.]|jgi:Ni/Co efflux regulator RcnB|nr:hypothetical protein [Halioglobus sp.]